MSAPRCPQRWQAEALEDGRLSGEQRRQFAAHAARCADCAREAAGLVRLRQLAGTLPLPPDSPFLQRRRREQLLQRANAQALGGRWAVPPRTVLAGAGLALLLLTAVLELSLRPSGAPAARPGLARPDYSLRSSAGGVWQVVEQGPLTRLRVQAGRFAVHVRPLGEGQRFLLDLPDGELEVHGTRFSVEVGGGVTRRVVVRQGRVALRLQGQPALGLGLGESWAVAAAGAGGPAAGGPGAGGTPAPGAVAGGGVPAPAGGPAAGVGPLRARPRSTAAAAEAPTSRRAAVSARSATAAAAVAAPAARPSRAARAAATGGPDEPAAEPTLPGADFAAAVAAFDRGDFGSAEQQWLGFEARHPGDSRVEDAAFLRAVARARRGDRDGARTLARDYLRRFPAGFRRTDAERLAH